MGCRAFHRKGPELCVPFYITRHRDARRLRLVQGAEPAIQSDGLLHEWSFARILFLCSVSPRWSTSGGGVEQHLFFSNYEDRRSRCHLAGTWIQLLAIAELPPTSRELQRFTGTFQFGPDFYQSNAKVTLSPRLSTDD